MESLPNLTQIAGFRAQPRSIGLGTLGVSLWVVEQLHEYVDGEALLRDTDAAEPPYWAYLWPASQALARLAATQIACPGRRVIEIGCGLGLVGIAAALRGASVTLLDTTSAALHFARASAALNECDVDLVQADVRCSPFQGHFDYAFAADVTYDPSLQVALAGFLATHLAPRGQAWCAESVRTFDQGLGETCLRLGLNVTAHDVCELDDGRNVWVRITEVRREPPL